MGFNKKALSKIKADLNSAKGPSKPRDIIYDPRGQWEHPGKPTRIPGGNITMQGVPYPVMAYPNVGQPQMMYPNQDYDFPGADYVDEYPQMKRGGSKKFTRDITATNILFTKNPYLKKKKKRKNRIYDPSAPYFQTGGPTNIQEEPDVVYNPSMEMSSGGMTHYKEGGKLGPIPLNSGRKVLRDWTYGESIGMLQEQDGGSTFTTQLSPEEEANFQDFYGTLPENLQQDDPSYDIRGYWDSEGRPESFNYDQPKEDDGYYHAYSINQNTGEYLKSPWHETFQHAVDEDRRIGWRPITNVQGRNVATENPSIASPEEQSFLRNTEGPVNDYIETELTPEEIQAYRDGGYVVEEVDEFQKGGTYYTVPGSKGVYRKVNGKWQVDWNKSGSFQPITKGDVAKRIAAIEKGKTQYFDKDYGDLVSSKSAKYQAAPKPQASKPTAAQTKAQQNFDKNFKVTNKSKYEKVEDKIQEDIQEYKDYMAAKGKVVPEDTDFADMIKRGWESYGNVKPWWRADPTDQIKASNPAPTGIERMWEYATNPFTAFEYAVSGGGAENMPYNINEMRMAGIDPGVVPGRNLVGNTANMFNLVDAGDKVGRNVEEGNYGTAALEAMRFIPGARMQTGIGNKVASYADDVLQTSKQAGKLKLPKYQNVYRSEHAGFNIPATSDDLTGRWFEDNPLGVKFYIQNLKDPITGKVVRDVDAPIRVIQQRLPEYKIKQNFGAGMPEDARVMSTGRGSLTNNELDELLGPGASDRFTNSTYTQNDINAMETAPFLFRNEEGILGADLVNKLRNRTNAGRFSSGRSNLFENKENAINYLYDEADKFYNPRTSISEYLPFKKGGFIEKELTPEEIEWYKSQGYEVEELD